MVSFFPSPDIYQVQFVLLIYSNGAQSTYMGQPLKKTDTPSFRSHQLSITPQLGPMNPSTLHARMLTGLILCKQPKLPWILVFSGWQLAHTIWSLSLVFHLFFPLFGFSLSLRSQCNLPLPLQDSSGALGECSHCPLWSAHMYQG